MKVISQDFIKAVNAQDYSKVEKLLKFMTYEKEWAGLVIWETSYFDHRFNDYESEVDKSWCQPYSANDCTPLVIAAISQNEKMVDLVLSRWPTNAADLIVRSYNACSKISDLLVQYKNIKLGKDETKKKVIEIDLNAIVQTKNLLRQHMAQRKVSYSFSSQDNHSWNEYVACKVNAIQNVNKLINFYESTVSFDMIPLLFHTGYFFSKTERVQYSSHAINLISLIQNRAHHLISQQEGDILYDSCQQLLTSEIFSNKHYQYGLGNRSLQDLIIELNAENLNFKVVQEAPVVSLKTEVIPEVALAKAYIIKDDALPSAPAIELMAEATPLASHAQSSVETLLDCIKDLFLELSFFPMKAIHFIEQIISWLADTFSHKEECSAANLALV